MAGIEGLLIGRTLGERYRIEEVIGRGGMGAVYRALDERLGRQVALKVISLTGVDDKEGQTRERLRARFFREARSAAALPHHPNVVPVYDYGTDDTLGLDYIVMELLRGSDLSSRLSTSRALPLARSLKIIVEAARGVAVGHRQGLIHRDIKPGNIFLTQTHSGEVQVRVVDFGIAKVADDDTLQQLTQDGRVPHSPAYASPEQLRGLDQLTPAADVFSLGAVAFQLLTGERPFSEGDRNRMSLGMPVDPPLLRDKNPAVPGAVEAIVRRALDFDPDERYADAAAMATDLERAVRAIGDTPLDPYLDDEQIVTAADEDELTEVPQPADRDRTQLAPTPQDDRTLLAPPPSPPSRAGGGASTTPAAGRPLPPPPPPRQTSARRRAPRSERRVGAMLVWGLVLVALAAASLWVWNEQMRTPASVVHELPPDTVTPPEETPEEPPDPDELEALQFNLAGVDAYNARRFEEALGLFLEAVLRSPSNPTLRGNYGLALLMLGRIDAAQQQFETAIELDSDLPASHYNLHRALVARGDTIGAIASLEDYLERETDPERQGLRDIAETQLQELRLSQDPNSPPLLGEPIIQQPDLSGSPRDTGSDAGDTLTPPDASAPDTPVVLDITAPDTSIPDTTTADTITPDTGQGDQP